MSSDSSDDERVSRSWRSTREIEDDKRKKEEEEKLSFKPMKIFNTSKQNVANSQDQIDEARQLFIQSNKDFEKLSVGATFYVDNAVDHPPPLIPISPSLSRSSSAATPTPTLAANHPPLLIPISPTLSRSSSTATLIASDGEWDEVSGAETPAPIKFEECVFCQSEFM